MANDYVRLPVDGSGKRLDAESLTVASLTVYRERLQVSGVNDDDIAAVVDTDPAGSDHGLVVRPLEYVSPQRAAASSASLAAGGEVDLDADTIPASTTGKLAGVTVSSSVPCRWEVKSRDGAVELTFAVLFTSALELTLTWEPPDKRFTTLAGDGVSENFRVTAKNLSQNQAADVYASFFWDEV